VKKYFIHATVILILVFGIILLLRFVIGGPEDNWICVNNQWVKHGNPSQPMPTSGCGLTSAAQIANPASVYCKDQGGETVIITAADGSQSGFCKFSDGRYCDEWQFFREHACAGPAISPSPTMRPKLIIN
jgi:uncharacterized protein